MEIIFFDIPSNPPPIAVRNSLTNQFFQKNLQFCIFSTNKKNAKLKRRDGSFQLLKLSKLCNHFLSSFENGNNFFFISIAIPRQSRSGKLMFLYIFNNNKKLLQVYIGISILVIPDHMLVCCKSAFGCNFSPFSLNWLRGRFSPVVAIYATDRATYQPTIYVTSPCFLNVFFRRSVTDIHQGLSKYLTAQDTHISLT